MEKGTVVVAKSVWASFAQLAQSPLWTWIVAVCGAFMAWAFPDEAQRIAARSVFIAAGIDTAMGLWCAYRMKQISSEGFAKLFTKLLVYFGLIVLLAATLDVLPMEVTVERSIMTGLLCFFIGRESLSFIENCKRMGYDAPPWLNKFFERFKDKPPAGL